MLVLRQVYKYRDSKLVPCSFVSLNIHLFANYTENPLLNFLANGLSSKFDVFDTEMGALQDGLTVEEITKIKDKVFGIFDYGNQTIFMSITKEVWSFLGVANEPEKLGIDFHSLLEDDCSTETGTNVHIIECRNKVKYVFHNSLAELDEFGIFWTKRNTAEFFTILGVYELLFSKIRPSDFEKEFELYIQQRANCFLKLDLNTKVMRFITKSMVLRK